MSNGDEAADGMQRICENCDYWDASADRPRMWRGTCLHIGSDLYLEVAEADDACEYWHPSTTDWKAPPRPHAYRQTPPPDAAT
jgi:hypothetical protein